MKQKFKSVQSSILGLWDSVTIFWAVKGFISPDLPLLTHSLFPRLRAAARYCCCYPQWLSSGTSISKMIGSSLKLGCSSINRLSRAVSSGTPNLPYGTKTQLFSMTTSALGFPLLLSLHFQHWPALYSGTKPQLFFIPSSFLYGKILPGKILYYQLQLPA